MFLKQKSSFIKTFINPTNKDISPYKFMHKVYQ